MKREAAKKQALFRSALAVLALLLLLASPAFATRSNPALAHDLGEQRGTTLLIGQSMADDLAAAINSKTQIRFPLYAHKTQLDSVYKRTVVPAHDGLFSFSPELASAPHQSYPKTRIRVSANPDGPHDPLTCAVTRFSRLGCSESSGLEVVESLDVPKRGGGINLLEDRAIQASPLDVRFGPARGGGGNALAQRYARQVTGGAEKAVYVRGVEFEGIRAGTLLDAKYARSAGSFYDISGMDRFTLNVKIPSLLGQARRQVGAIKGLGFRGIEWHFADEAVAGSVRGLFVQNRIPIVVRHTPLIGVP